MNYFKISFIATFIFLIGCNSCGENLTENNHNDDEIREIIRVKLKKDDKKVDTGEIRLVDSRNEISILVDSSFLNRSETQFEDFTEVNVFYNYILDTLTGSYDTFPIILSDLLSMQFSPTLTHKNIGGLLKISSQNDNGTKGSHLYKGVEVEYPGSDCSPSVLNGFTYKTYQKNGNVFYYLKLSTTDKYGKKPIYLRSDNEAYMKKFTSEYIRLYNEGKEPSIGFDNVCTSDRGVLYTTRARVVDGTDSDRGSELDDKVAVVEADLLMNCSCCFW